VDGLLPRQLPLRLDRNQLPDSAATALAVAQFLVVGRRRTVLPRLSDYFLPHRRAAHPVVAARETGDRAGRHHRCVLRTVGDPDCLRSHRRLLLTSHPRLGAGHRCSRGRGHRLVAHAAQVTWSRPHLGGHGWHRLRCRRLQQPHPLPRILGGDPGGGHGAGHRGRRHRADRRGGMVAQAGPTPVGGQALVLDLPVALAPSGHCGRGRRQVRSPLPPKPRVAGPWP
jgi:hypothetical protein